MLHNHNQLRGIKKTLEMIPNCYAHMEVIIWSLLLGTHSFRKKLTKKSIGKQDTEANTSYFSQQVGQLRLVEKSVKAKKLAIIKDLVNFGKCFYWLSKDSYQSS